MTMLDPLAKTLGGVPGSHELHMIPGGFVCDWCGPMDSTEGVWHWSEIQASAARVLLSTEVEDLTGGTGSWDDAITAAVALIRANIHQEATGADAH